MKKCKYCNISIHTEKSFCPICFNRLDENESENEQFYTLRTKNQTTVKASRFIYKLMLFISICLITACFAVNFFTTPDYLWAFIVLFSVIYVWVLVAHTILSKKTAFKKIFLQIVSVLSLLFVTQQLSLYGWLANYVFPSVCISAVLTSLMLIFLAKKRHEYLIGFGFIYIILNIGSILLISLKVDTFHILNIINIFLCSLSLLGVLIFGFNDIKHELTKKWHI